MPQCIKLLPAGSIVGVAGGANVISTTGIFVNDNTCASGLQVLNTAELAEQRQTIKVDKTSDPEVRADLMDMFYIFIVVLVVIWGLKQLLNLFASDTSKD